MAALESVGFSILWSVLVLIVGVGVLWILRVLQSWLQARLAGVLLRQGETSVRQYLGQLHFLLASVLRLIFWASYLFVLALVVTFVLRQFDFSHDIGVRLSLWLGHWLQHLLAGVLVALPVKSRMIIWPFHKQVWLFCVPVFHRLQGCFTS